MSFLVPEEATEAELRARLAERPDCRRSRLALAALVGGVEAEGHFRAVLDLWPDDAEALIGLAELLAGRGDFPAAVELAQRLLRRDPDFLAAHRLLAQAWETLFDRGRAGTHWRRCLEIDPDDGAARAGLARLAETPKALPADYVRCLFDQFSEDYDDRMRRRLRYRGPERVKEALEATGGLPPAGLDILDLGCGTGLMGEVLRPYARRLDGIDLSPGMIDKARERGFYDSLRVAEMLEALAAESGIRDLVVAADALVYLGDLKEVFRAAAPALKASGRFAGTVEESTGPDVDLQPSRRFRHSRGHIAACAATAGLDLAFLESASYREENKVPVPSLVFVAVKA